MKKSKFEKMIKLAMEDMCMLEKGIYENKHKFSEEEMQRISERLPREKQRLQDIYEVFLTAKNLNHELLPEQVAALEEAFIASDRKDWIRCRSALEVFFEWEKDEYFMHFDISNWDYRHIIRWFKMLNRTKLCNEPIGTPARIFSLMIYEQVILKMPPELYALIENSTTCTEDGQKCFTLAEVAEVLGMSEAELIESLTNAGIGEYVLIEDQNHTLH